MMGVSRTRSAGAKVTDEENYEKSLTLDPANNNAKENLKKIRELKKASTP